MSSGFIETILSTCETVAKTSKYVHVSEEGIKTFIASLQTDPWYKEMLESTYKDDGKSEIVVFGSCDSPQDVVPTFSSPEAEINFLTCYGLLQFGGGFRNELHAAVNRGASDTMTLGLVHLYNTLKTLDAESLSCVDISTIHSAFGIEAVPDLEALS